jgi:glycosyltransferase involved in cell wall biosynthesis
MISQSPPLTVGIPVFNGEVFIAECIQSLLKQGFDEYKIIISDNCSTDGTEEICKEYAKNDSRITYIRHSSNKGAPYNFGFLLKASSSPFFMWSAADDLWEQDYLEEAMNCLHNSSSGFCFPTFRVSSINKNTHQKFPRELFSFIESDVRKTRVLEFTRLHHYSHKCNLVYSLFRSDLLRAAYKLQDIGNDGVLSTIILGMTKGIVLDNFRFNKRYQDDWPSLYTALKRMLITLRIDDFKPYREAGRSKLIGLFPEYSQEIHYIFDRYKQNAYHKGYTICDLP